MEEETGNQPGISESYEDDGTISEIPPNNVEQGFTEPIKITEEIHPQVENNPESVIIFEGSSAKQRLNNLTVKVHGCETSSIAHNDAREVRSSQQEIICPLRSASEIFLCPRTSEEKEIFTSRSDSDLIHIEKGLSVMDWSYPEQAKNATEPLPQQDCQSPMNAFDIDEVFDDLEEVLNELDNHSTGNLLGTLDEQNAKSEDKLKEITSYNEKELHGGEKEDRYRLKFNNENSSSSEEETNADFRPPKFSIHKFQKKGKKKWIPPFEITEPSNKRMKSKGTFRNFKEYDTQGKAQTVDEVPSVGMLGNSSEDFGIIWNQIIATGNAMTSVESSSPEKKECSPGDSDSEMCVDEKASSPTPALKKRQRKRKFNELSAAALGFFGLCSTKQSGTDTFDVSEEIKQKLSDELSKIFQLVSISDDAHDDKSDSALRQTSMMPQSSKPSYSTKKEDFDLFVDQFLTQLNLIDKDTDKCATENSVDTNNSAGDMDIRSTFENASENSTNDPASIDEPDVSSKIDNRPNDNTLENNNLVESSDNDDRKNLDSVNVSFSQDLFAKHQTEAENSLPFRISETTTDFVNASVYHSGDYLYDDVVIIEDAISKNDCAQRDFDSDYNTDIGQDTQAKEMGDVPLPPSNEFQTSSITCSYSESYNVDQSHQKSDVSEEDPLCCIDKLNIDSGHSHSVNKLSSVEGLPNLLCHEIPETLTCDKSVDNLEDKNEFSGISSAEIPATTIVEEAHRLDSEIAKEIFEDAHISETADGADANCEDCCTQLTGDQNNASINADIENQNN